METKLSDIEKETVKLKSSEGNSIKFTIWVSVLKKTQTCSQDFMPLMETLGSLQISTL